MDKVSIYNASTRGSLNRKDNTFGTVRINVRNLQNAFISIRIFSQVRKIYARIK